MSCGPLSSPGPEPVFPHALMNRPSFEYLTIRSIETARGVAVRDEDVAVRARSSVSVGATKAPGSSLESPFVAQRHDDLCLAGA